MFHLTLRAAWHDLKWAGCICKKPSQNSFCVALDRIHIERKDEIEDDLAESGRAWEEFDPEEQPPCKAESGIFMNPQEWSRRFIHPYVKIASVKETHGHMKPTWVKVPPFSTFAVPFGWMLRRGQDDIDKALPDPLPPDEEPPFHTAWVFSRARQEALLKLFFGRLHEGRSLVFFYTKEGQPLGDTISRLVLGVGRISKINPPKPYEVEGSKPSYLMWDRLLRHSIRSDGHDGFLLPYHDYLEPTGDQKEDERRLNLLKEIAVPAEKAHFRTFSYAAELASPDIALSTLVQCLEAVRKIRKHGIAPGPWERREEWLNEQIALAWQDRGPFPGLGPVLEALDMRLGTALVLELFATGVVGVNEDPWPVVDAILRGIKKPPQSCYNDDIEAVSNTWAGLKDERRDLLKLLSRFALTSTQAKRWFDPRERRKGTLVSPEDREILGNPFIMSEVDLGDRNDSPISVGMIDRGLLPDSTIAAKHPVPSPSFVGSPQDNRRIRAAIVEVLRKAANDGDALLAEAEVRDRVTRLNLSHPCAVGVDWPSSNRDILKNVVELVNVITDRDGSDKIPTLQLSDLKGREDILRRVLSKRAARAIPELKVDWKTLLVQAISDVGGEFNPGNARHVRAIEEQSIALQRIMTRRLSVLVGRAGTGKTSVMGALMLCKEIAKDGILLLAPTGKARVRLGKATAAEAMTVAQFLNGLKRYDTARQRPLYQGDTHRREKTVVIDECSMLTMDDLVAVIRALDLAHVERLILVGDPNQLPPIGVGRPFADLVAFLEQTTDHTEADKHLHALARLSVEVRTAALEDEASDALRLASWFTREPQPVDADRVLSDLELGNKFNDLEILLWKNPDDLRARMHEVFQRHLGLKGKKDIAGFDKALGLNDKGWVPFDDPSGSERWQILSPVRMHPHGVHDLNRWVQQSFRAKELKAAAERKAPSLGDENIVKKDKVIQLRNEKRMAWDGSGKEKHYIANGEVGLVAIVKKRLKVIFAGRPGYRFDYWGGQFGEGGAPLELAYALTVHKAQGREFRKVFVVLPKNCRLLSRELLYTALTRSREQLVLLIEGEDSSMLFDLTRPERSEVANRNTNIFQGVVRAEADATPYAEHLIHTTDKGHLVRSKSELVIANKLFGMGIDYYYERIFEGTAEPGLLRPDFSFVTPEGDLILWEHLGLLHLEDYRRGWEWKRQWYEQNGFELGKTLFISRDDERGGLDSGELRNTAEIIKKLLE